MIQHISRYLLICLFIQIFIACKSKPINNNASPKVEVDGNDKLRGKWYCSYFEKDNRLNSDYSLAFAEESSKFLHFEIKGDTILFGDCLEKFYKYSYFPQKGRYGEETVFTTHFKDEKSEVSFYRSSNYDNSCLPVENSLFYYDDNKIIIQDRGYFFVYKKESNFNNLSHFVEGIPGNNRNNWKVKGTYKNMSISDAYIKFLNEFKYGSKDIVEKIPNKSIVDEGKLVDYKVSEKEIVISKSDPMGIIKVIFTKEGSDVDFLYKLEYPDY